MEKMEPNKIKSEKIKSEKVEPKRIKTEKIKPDQMETLGNSIIQHGRHSDRIYLMKCDPDDRESIVDTLDDLAREEEYSKIFAKVPASMEEVFLGDDYTVEARVAGFFNADEDGLFMGKFLTPDRAVPDNAETIANVLDVALSKADAHPKPYDGKTADISGFEIQPLDTGHAETMAHLYSQVFESYPFPIFDPEFIKETMESHVYYFGVFQESELVALSSAETDMASLNVEMTDFATLPQVRGQGLAELLLATMGSAVSSMGIQTAYPIARATSHGMNITFSRGGYSFAGTLVNNTNISGGLESMNVWWKDLTPQAG
jgi:putative beta-lysine N-acetyltransferase